MYFTCNDNDEETLTRATIEDALKVVDSFMKFYNFKKIIKSQQVLKIDC